MAGSHKLHNMLPVWALKQHEIVNSLNEDFAVKQFRQKHWQAVLEYGLPTAQDERWKYADLSVFAQAYYTLESNTHDDIQAVINEYRIKHPGCLLIVMLNGRYARNLSDEEQIPQAIKIGSRLDHFEFYQQIVQQDQHNYAFAHLNKALSLDGLCIQIPDDYALQPPLHILSLTTQTNIYNPAHVIVLGDRAKLTLVEHYQSLTAHAYLMNSQLHIKMGDAAILSHYKVQNENNNVTHIAHTFIHAAKESDVACHHFNFGAHFARDELAIDLRGIHARASAKGFYLLNRDQQYTDYHVDIRHLARCTVSEMFYKGIVKENSRAVFNGKLYVANNAQKTTAYQANHNLLLSKRAEVYSKPELEIYADDVKCKHGATTGQLNEEALYYLCSRGISRALALNMLVKAFADEILQTVHLVDIKQFLQLKVLGHES